MKKTWAGMKTDMKDEMEKSKMTDKGMMGIADDVLPYLLKILRIIFICLILKLPFDMQHWLY